MDKIDKHFVYKSDNILKQEGRHWYPGPMRPKTTMRIIFLHMYFLTLYILYCFPLHTARHALLGYYPGENVTAAILQKFTSNKSADKSCVRTKLHNGMVLTLDNDIYFEGSSHLTFLMWGHRSWSRRSSPTDRRWAHWPVCTHRTLHSYETPSDQHRPSP